MTSEEARKARVDAVSKEWSPDISQRFGISADASQQAWAGYNLPNQGVSVPNAWAQGVCQQAANTAQSATYTATAAALYTHYDRAALRLQALAMVPHTLSEEKRRQYADDLVTWALRS